MTDKPFLPYDCCRCRNESCADRDSCLRYLTRDDVTIDGSLLRIATLAFAKDPKNKRECGLYAHWYKQ